MIAPNGRCFTFDELRPLGIPPWELYLDEDVNVAKRFSKFYRLIDNYCMSCYLDDEIERLFEDS